MARNILGSTREASQGNLYHYYLPKGILNLQITHGPGGFAIELAEPSVDLIPDPDHNYFLKYSPNIFTHDEIQVSFSPQGFLKHIKTSIDDQTDDFISKITDIASAVAQIAIPLPKTRSTEIQVIHSGPLDPFDSDEVKTLIETMKQVDAEAVFEMKELTRSARDSAQAGQNTEGGFGIYYRPMSTFAMTLGGKRGNIRTLLRMPHPTQVHFIEIPIASWVKTDFEIQFDEGGYPSNIHISKPSSALAFAQVPLNFLSAILRLPGELFKFRIDLNSAKQDALQREQQFREQMALLQQRQESLSSANEVPSQNTRGIFDWGFFKRNKPVETGSANAGSSGASAAIPSDLDDQLKKIKQDIQVIRRRVNEMNEKN